MSLSDQLPHLLVENTARSERYVSPQRGGGDFKLPPRDRPLHGAHLLGELEQTRKDNETSRGITTPADRPAGIVLEVHSEPGMPLKLDSLENRPQGIELNAVKEENGVQIATIYVPDGKLVHLQKILNQYVSEDSPGGKPKNQKLVESISKIGIRRLYASWTDSAPFPDAQSAIWWELWLRAEGDQDAVLGVFRGHARAARLQVGEDLVRFPDRIVVLCHGTVAQLTGSLALLDLVAEVRSPKENPAPFIELTPRDQGEWVDNLRRRLAPPSADAPAVCLLDAGVRLHPLLAPVFNEADAFKYHPSWPLTDANTHGTEMAGLATYGDDLPGLLAGTESVTLLHRLESVKIHPFPPGQDDPRLYGDITAQAVYLVESHHPDRARTFCLSITYPDGRDRGLPSAWSAELDQICMGVRDDKQRLIFVAAGNTDREQRHRYPASNDTDQIHDPAQSWNAVTVGAYTDRVLFPNTTYPDWRPVARPGSLSPSSTTSLLWDSDWPLKPDIVLEGGNHVMDPTGTKTDSPEEMSLLTTAHATGGRLLVATGDTSAATALAARMGAVIVAKYPSYWPETVRALLIHSAEWTKAMLEEFSGGTKQDLQNRMRRYGYGVPSLLRALYSAKNSLTLVAQGVLQPYDKDGTVKPKEMHIHELPWPTDVLNGLGETAVTMRVTLSYFISPSPGKRGWTRRHRYQSHGLRFKVRRPEETLDDFRQRVSKAARDEEEEYGGAMGSSRGWTIGDKLRSKGGSIHSDWWQGTAAQLASCRNIAVFPISGWWRDRPHLNCWNRRARYALVVTIHTQDTQVDLYTPVEAIVKAAIKPPVLTEIEVEDEAVDDL